jgi:hypothetical protein
MALRRANRVRLARAALKRQIAAGERSAAEVILTCPWEARSMTAVDVLASQRRWGQTRSRKLLRAARVSESRTIAEMSERQRRHLAGTLDTATDAPRLA